MSADKAQIRSVWLPTRKSLNGWSTLCFEVALWLPPVLLVEYTGLNVAVVFDIELAKLSSGDGVSGILTRQLWEFSALVIYPAKQTNDRTMEVIKARIIHVLVAKNSLKTLDFTFAFSGALVDDSKRPEFERVGLHLRIIQERDT